MNFKKAVMLVSLTGALGLGVLQVRAAGFELLPIAGASAYSGCRSGNGFDGGIYPPLTDSACVVPNGVAAALLFSSLPETGYSVVIGQTFSTSITNFSDPIGTLNERVWRNSTTSECIYGKQIIMSDLSTNDYNSQLSGTQRLEVNDFAFGGYTGDVKAAYAKANSIQASVIRIGRTFTSVQRQVSGVGGGLCPGFLHQPIIGGIPGTEINGVGLVSTCSVSPTASQQAAPLSANWVDFTTYASAGISPEGLLPTPSSPNFYIKQTCTSGAASLVTSSMKLRQTGRVYQPWVVVTTSSRAPSSSIAP